MNSIISNFVHLFQMDKFIQSSPPSVAKIEDDDHQRNVCYSLGIFFVSVFTIMDLMSISRWPDVDRTWHNAVCHCSKVIVKSRSLMKKTSSTSVKIAWVMVFYYKSFRCGHFKPNIAFEVGSGGIFKFWEYWYLFGSIARKKGTRRAQIPLKPLDPPISWIVTQSLIFQIADTFCVFSSTQVYKRPFLWSNCGSVQQWCRRETPELKIQGWIPGDHELLYLSRGSEQ